MHGKEDRVTPGNGTRHFNAILCRSRWLTPSATAALAVQPDKPFRGLEMFGTGFLSKFQSSECSAPLLEELTFIDTPGVLSGEKQRIGRAYDFVKVRRARLMLPP